MVALLSIMVLLAAVVGGGYGYLRYRYDQINKVHINAKVAAADGGPFTILVIGSDSRVARARRTARPRWSRVSAATSCSLARHTVDQADPDPLHPTRPGRLHAWLRRVAVRHL